MGNAIKRAGRAEAQPDGRGQGSYSHFMRIIGPVLASCCLFLFVFNARADDLSGTWAGSLTFPSSALLFVITISNGENGLSATASSPYQSDRRIAVDAISESDGMLHFSISRLDVDFNGKIASNSITGTFTQRGIAVPLVLTPSSIGTRSLAGPWLATLEAPGGSRLLLGLNVRGSSDHLSATLDSPYQNGFEIPVTAISSTNGELTFAISSIGTAFNGKIGSDSIAGTFTQSGQVFPLTFARPQAASAYPSPPPRATPYPTPAPHFSSRDVTFPSAKGTILDGTVTVPSNVRGPMPAFVFVHGSGPETRDGGVPQNPTFLDLSNALSNDGFVVLRYDKRGIAKSTGTPTEDWRILADDVRAATAYLRQQPYVDPNRIVLLGHSEGGLIVPLVAPSIPGIAGIVLMAPPAIPFSKIIQEQSGRMTPSLRKSTEAAFVPYEGIDPASVILKITVPILVLQGDADIQILPVDLNHLTERARAAGKRIDTVILAGDDHLFLSVPPTTSSDGSEYAIPAYLDPRVSDAIVKWFHGIR